MYEYKELYTLDFRGLRDFFEMHTIIRDSLNFPDYYGANLDALWDCLTQMTDLPLNIEILGLDRIGQLDASTAEEFLSLMQDFKKYALNDSDAGIRITLVGEDGSRTVL